LKTKWTGRGCFLADQVILDLINANNRMDLSIQTPARAIVLEGIISGASLS